VYAIIQAGGRQVKVVPGATVQVDGTTGDAGAKVTYEQVLFLAKDGGELLAGAPFVAGAKVLGVIEGEARGPKIRVFKKKRRKGFRRAAAIAAPIRRCRSKTFWCKPQVRCSHGT